MSRHVPALHMSHIIASDAPLSSPLSDATPWDHPALYSPTLDAFAQLNYHYSLPPSPPHSVGSASTDSPVPAHRVLKSSRLSPEGSEPEQTLCLPTHQVFDLPPAPSPSPAPSLSEQQQLHEPQPRLSISINAGAVPAKRPSSSAPAAVKKARAGERITTKDFVPPDVSGLSKREARLVKNRAAAFLSRQRKREEFENMEIRVQELEQENARLLALTQQGGAPQQDEGHDELQSQVEQLRAQLAAVQARERELAEQLQHKSSARTPSSPVKTEAPEPQLPAVRSVNAQSVHREKSAASLGLMVLLCALPTLLSMPAHAVLPTMFSLPLSDAPASALPSALDMHAFLPGEYDWAPHAGLMDLDTDLPMHLGDRPALAPSHPSKLEFVDADGAAPLGLGELDISFDALPAENGKIRVRIHPPSSAAPSAASSVGSPAASSQGDEDHAMWGGSESGSGPGTSAPSPMSLPPLSSADEDALGPFLGAGAGGELLASPSGVPLMLPSQSGFDFDFDAGYGSSFGSGSAFSRASSPACGRRRVRIALRSMPGRGHEGGEWEVEVC
ncbi:hypothetical protein AcV5_002274 [Taiwanofungus camphoratus]|nr:hypothetical protein AcV5_002274 [Antrodia cinnamomea]